MGEARFLGTIVARGYRFGISSLSLHQGKLWITAVAAGPIPKLEGEPVAIFGEDGQGFAQGGHLTMPVAAGPGTTAQVVVDLRMTKIKETDGDH
jgi:hypothetical protein